jgi:hypothetical protein
MGQDFLVLETGEKTSNTYTILEEVIEVDPEDRIDGYEYPEEDKRYQELEVEEQVIEADKLANQIKVSLCLVALSSISLYT